MVEIMQVLNILNQFEDLKGMSFIFQDVNE